MKSHKGGYLVRIDEGANLVKVSMGKREVVLDKMYRYCSLCDGVRPLAQFTWRSMAGEQLRTQPYCERHSRKGKS